MNWDTFFEEAESITAQETLSYMESGEPDRYQLVDVRQPREYEEAHIPGSILLPLAEIPGRHGELNPDKPAIVYCRSGARSKAACQLLNRLGMKHVFNMTGGFMTWQGEKLRGDTDAGLEYFATGDFDTTFEMAIQMENGLKLFYQSQSEMSDNQAVKEVLTHLAHFEDGHISKLKSKYGKEPGLKELSISEGGLDTGEMLRIFDGQLGSPEEVLQLGMKLEAQAFDLYTRLAWKHQGEETAAFFQEMAGDEHKHLMKISTDLDKLLGS